MSFFKELKYQLMGTFGDLESLIRFSGEEEKGKSSNYNDALLSFKCNGEMFVGKLVYDEEDNALVEMQVINIARMEALKYLFLPEEVFYRKFKINGNLDFVGEHLEEGVITDKYVISDMIVEFKRKYKTADKMFVGLPHKI